MLAHKLPVDPKGFDFLFGVEAVATGVTAKSLVTLAWCELLIAGCTMTHGSSLVDPCHGLETQKIEAGL
jgi:hypothetical protein